MIRLLLYILLVVIDGAFLAAFILFIWGRVGRLRGRVVREVGTSLAIAVILLLYAVLAATPGYVVHTGRSFRTTTLASGVVLGAITYLSLVRAVNRASTDERAPASYPYFWSAAATLLSVVGIVLGWLPWPTVAVFWLILGVTSYGLLRAVLTSPRST